MDPGRSRDAREGEERRPCSHAAYARLMLVVAAVIPFLVSSALARIAVAETAARPQGDRDRLGGALQPERQPEGGYVVVRVRSGPGQERERGFAAVAGDIARFHKARLLDFDGADFDRLAAGLGRQLPRHVLFVVPPKMLDINLHRRVLLLSAGLDGDVFPDFAFGYLTAEDASQLRAFWGRIRRAHQQRAFGRRWISTGVSVFSRIYPGSIPAVAREAGYEGKSIYWSTVENDAKTMAFVSRHLKELEQADVISMTGNGDPQGIWLFSGNRNRDKSKHWEYEREKVGQHADEMPRIMASRFWELKLESPIVWSGTCHCAATCRVYVEGDIVSTFGRTDVATVHRLKPRNSICLSLIKAGVLAFLAPIGANHGMSVSMEQDHAFTHGADLGETIKATYDDVFLAARGNLLLDFQEEGKPQRRGEAVMQGGGSNRILIGDPRLAPFPKTGHPAERLRIVRHGKNTFDVIVEWDKGWHARAWDMFGGNRKQDWRIKARVALDGLVPSGRKLGFSASVAATDATGNPFPYVLRHCEPESFHGRRFLHLQANAPRKAVERKAVRAVFAVSWR